MSYGPYPDLDVPQIVAGPGQTLQAEVIGDQYVVSAVPEPASLVLLGLSLVSLVLVRRKRV